MQTCLKPRQEASPSCLVNVHDLLELNGYRLKPGDWLELYVFGHWIPGRVDADASGWYILTLDHVGIRLRAGLRARLTQDTLACIRPSETLRRVQEP